VVSKKNANTKILWNFVCCPAEPHRGGLAPSHDYLSDAQYFVQQMGIWGNNMEKRRHLIESESNSKRNRPMTSKKHARKQDATAWLQLARGTKHTEPCEPNKKPSAYYLYVDA